MDNRLHTYLEIEWRKDNHNKYQHYFSEWVVNLTTTQIFYFTKQMNKLFK
ncbi:MAG: hypothetical protein ACOCVF_01170 [bacterium]